MCLSDVRPIGALGQNHIEALVNALSIEERANVYSRNGIMCYDTKPIDDWMSIRGLTSDEHLEEYCDLSGITKDEMNNGLSEIDSKRRQALVEELTNTEWFKDFDEVLYNYYMKSDEVKASIKNYDLSFSILPFVYFIQVKLNEVISNLSNITVSGQVIERLIESSINSLVKINTKTSIWELHEYKTQLGLEGDDSSERFNDFIRKRFVEDEALTQYYSKYPVLARRTTEKAKFILNHFSEFLTRIDADYYDLKKELKVQTSELSKVKCEQGDTHEQSRSVIEFSFDTVRIMYKPKKLRIQKVFNDLLDWFSEKSDLDLQTCKSVYREKYAYVEFINYNPCSNQSAIHDYYKRYGMLCSIVYLLEGNDIHYENIIANGEHPVIIDVETLFQFKSDILKIGDDAFATAYKSCIDSISATGLLPIIAFKKGIDGEGIDISGLNGVKQKYPHKVLGVVNANSDDMKFDYQEFMVGGGNNVPYLGEEKILFNDYVDDILTGMKLAFDTVTKNKETFLKECLSKFKGVEVRHLMKATQNYAKLNEFSSHPNYTEDMPKLEKLFFNSWGYNYKNKKLVPYEIKDLLNDDIPIFYGLTDSTALFGSEGEVINDYFEISRYEVVENRIVDLNDIEVGKQLAHARISLGKYQEYSLNRLSELGKNIEKEVNIFDGESIKTVLKEEIEDIFQKILKNKVWGSSKNDFTFINPIFDDKNNVWKMSPVDMSLYQGLSGYLLLLVELYSVYKSEDIKKLMDVVTLAIAKNKDEQSPSSAYYGIGSAIFPLCAAYKATGEDHIRSEVYRLFKILEGNMPSHSDWISGRAGVAGLFILAYEVFNDENLLKSAEQIIEGLVAETNNNMNLGMAHGLAGIYYTLVRFSKHRPKYMDLIKILKSKLIEGLPLVEETSWCNGKVGILDALLSGDLKQAEKDIVRNEMMACTDLLEDNDCVCHGNGSKVLLLNEYVQTFKDQEVENHKHSLVSKMVSRKRTNGTYNYREFDEYPDMSLFLGSSGTAMTYMSLCESQLRPNILRLTLKNQKSHDEVL